MMKRLLAAIAVLSLGGTMFTAIGSHRLFAADAEPSPGGDRVVRSPDGTIVVTVHAEGALTYSVAIDGQPVVRASKLGLRFRDGAVLGRDAALQRTVSRTVDSTWENPLGKRRQVRDRCGEMRLLLREQSEPARDFEIVFRAYDDGVAFRYVLPKQAGMGDFILEQELTEFAFAGNHVCYAGQHENGSFGGSQEWEFKPGRLSDLKPASVIGSPLLVQTPRAWVALTESDLRDWAGLWYAGAADVASDTTDGVAVAAKLAPRLDKQGLVRGSTPHQSPWRVMMIARQPGQLVESDLIANLATPCLLDDPSWIKPGIASWDWWSQVSRMNTEGIKEFIQFSADMGWEYMLIDAGWMSGGRGGGGAARGGAQGRGGITTVNPAMDMEELLRFAKEKNVGLWLWLHHTSVDGADAYKEGFPVYQKWGIVGVKIDFMDRDDQEMVNWYEKIARAAADCHLMVDFHGAFKPSGFQRTYPNQVTREGILGNEYNRWSARVTPEHKVTLPFTRLLSGPGDYTVGGFLNRQPNQFQTNVRPTQVQGTRCNELALFVVYDNGALCCACDHPRNYRDQPGLDFLKVVPTVWDDTKVLDADVAKHIVVARRSGDDWFLGAMTDRSAREIPLKLGFLGEGRWTMRLWKDAADSDVNAEHLDVEDRAVSPGDTVTLKLAPAGGCVARFQKE